ncbi:MAG: MFS transporter, partial [Actinomycetales bacterium]
DASKDRKDGHVSSAARRAVILCGASGFASMYVLLSVSPAVAGRQAGSVAAGAATGIFMIATVLTQVMTPWAMRRWSTPRLLAASLVLLGAPAGLISINVDVSTNVAAILVVAAVRGIGFGLVTIVATSAVATLAEEGKRGAALGWYGLATATTGIIGPALGLALLDASSAQVPGVVAALLPVLGLLLIPAVARGVPPHEPAGGDQTPPIPWHALGKVWLPLAAFVPAATVYGGIYTFLYLSTSNAPVLLLIFGGAFAIARLLSGRLSDRISPYAIIAPAGLLAAGGMAGVALSPLLALQSVSALVMGAGIGAVTNATLSAVMSRLQADEYPVGSMAWNMAFDIGIACGGLVIGMLVVGMDYFGAYLSMAVLLLVPMVLGVLGILRGRPQPRARA